MASVKINKLLPDVKLRLQSFRNINASHLKIGNNSNYGITFVTICKVAVRKF